MPNKTEDLGPAEVLRIKYNETVARAGQIEADAKKSGRTLTHDDRALMKNLIKHAAQLGEQIKAVESDRELLEELKNLDGPGGGDSTLSKGWRSTSHEDGRWGHAFQKSFGFRGAKELNPSGAFLAPPAFDPEVHREGVTAQEHRIRPLIPTAPPVTGDHVVYFRQVLRELNAGFVAAGDLKPESDLEVQKVEEKIRTVAHLTKPLHRNDLADAPTLLDFINSELRLGLIEETDRVIINGDPTIPTRDEPLGLSNLSGIQAQAWDTDIFRTTRKAKTKSVNAGGVPSHYLLNEVDWEEIELLRDAEQRFHSGSPFSGGPTTLWGVPVVTSKVVPVGVGYIGPFKSDVKIFPRQEAKIDWSENYFDPNALGPGVGASDFQRNLIRFRAEERMTIAWLRPFGFVEIDLTAA